MFYIAYDQKFFVLIFAKEISSFPKKFIYKINRRNWFGAAMKNIILLKKTIGYKTKLAVFSKVSSVKIFHGFELKIFFKI